MTREGKALRIGDSVTVSIDSIDYGFYQGRYAEVVRTYGTEDSLAVTVEFSDQHYDFLFFHDRELIHRRVYLW